MSTPTVSDRRVRRDRATGLGLYPRRLAAARTRWAVSSLTSSRVLGLSAREAVAGCTPAAAATSRNVAGRSLVPIPCRLPSAQAPRIRLQPVRLAGSQATARARAQARRSRGVDAHEGPRRPSAGRVRARPCQYGGMRITGVESTSLFTGSAGRPLQIIRVTVAGTPGDQPGGAPGSLLVGGPGIGSPGPFGMEMPAPGRQPRGGGRRGRRRPAPAGGAGTGHGDRPGRRRAGRARRDDHGRRAGLDDVDGQPFPLRPGVVDHAGAVHRGAARAAGRGRRAARHPDGVRPGAAAPGEGAAGRGLQVRARGGRLPQAALRRLPRGPGAGAGPAGGRAAGTGRRHVQRAEHQPHRGRGHDPQRRLRRRLPARRARRRPALGVDARQLRARPGLPRADGRRRADLVVVGARAVPPVGTGR